MLKATSFKGSQPYLRPLPTTKKGTVGYSAYAAANSVNKIQQNRELYIRSSQAFLSGSLDELFEAAATEPEFVLEPFLRNGEATLVYAASGLGKSFYAAGLAVAMASGGEYLGYKAPRPLRVRYVDGEMSTYDLSVRIKAAINDNTDLEMLMKNLRISSRETHTNIHTTFPDISENKYKEQIVKELLEDGIEAVIFDNFSTLAFGVEDENAAGSFNGTLELILALKSVGIVPILIHHATKQGATYRGSSKIEAVFSNIIGLHREKDLDPKKGVGFSIRFDKNRSLHNSLTEVRAVQYIKDDGEWHEVESSGAQTQIVVTALKSLKYTTLQEIADGLGWKSKGTVSKWLNRAIAEGLLSEKEKEALFQLSAKQRDSEMEDFYDENPDF